MTKKNIDYTKTILYKIVCNDLSIPDCYVGHTTSFKNRKCSHKQYANGYIGQNANCFLYKFINENGGWDNWDMIEIEKYPCNDGNEAKAKERYWYETLKSTLNTRSPYLRLISKSITCKEWRNSKERFMCSCGANISPSNKERHLKTKKHQDFVKVNDNQLRR